MKRFLIPVLVLSLLVLSVSSAFAAAGMYMNIANLNFGLCGIHDKVQRPFTIDNVGDSPLFVRFDAPSWVQVPATLTVPPYSSKTVVAIGLAAKSGYGNHRAMLGITANDGSYFQIQCDMWVE